MFVHIDIDYFFAQAEELRNPSLKGKVVVVAMFTPRGGAVSTVNYEGRRYGIKAGMALGEAKKRAPKDAAFLKADKEYYAQLSFEIDQELRKIFKRITQVSIDEWNAEGGEKEAREAKNRIAEMGLSCSVGVAPSVLGAKLAANAQKPKGFVVWNEEQERAYIEECEVKKIPGIGEKTAQALNSLGVRKVKDLKRLDAALLIEMFGKKGGGELLKLARGEYSKDIGEEGINEISTLTTLPRSTREREELFKAIKQLEGKLKERLKALNMAFKTLTIMFITDSFKMHTKSKTFNLLTAEADLDKEIKALIEEGLTLFGEKVRRVGIKFGDLEEIESQKTLSEFF